MKPGVAAEPAEPVARAEPVAAVLFDAHGVLYDRPTSTERFVAALLAREGASARPSAEVAARLEALKRDASCGRVGHQAYWDAFLEAHGVLAAPARDRLRAQIEAQTHAIVPLPGAASTLRALADRGLRLGVVTDTMYPLAWKMAWLARIGVADLVTAVACSTQVGAHKPDPAIYQYALERLGVAPAAAVFVGHATHELDGARRTGLATVAVNYDPDARADYFIRALPDLLALPIVPPLPTEPPRAALDG